MKLDYFFFRSKINQKDFAKIVGLLPSQISDISRRKYEPQLFNALKIHYASGKKVRLEDMLNEEHLKELYLRFGVTLIDEEAHEKL